MQQEKAIPSLFLRIPGTGFLICLKPGFFFFSPRQHPFSVVSNCSVLEDIIWKNLLTHLLANAFFGKKYLIFFKL